MNYIEKIKQEIKEMFEDKYCDINWHYDGGMEKKIMENECRDLQLEVQELIEDRFKELDETIEEWQSENKEQWDKKELEDLKTDLLYEYNNDL